jgi:hypothetical protein
MIGLDCRKPCGILTQQPAITYNFIKAYFNKIVNKANPQGLLRATLMRQYRSSEALC